MANEKVKLRYTSQTGRGLIDNGAKRPNNSSGMVYLLVEPCKPFSVHYRRNLGEPLWHVRGKHRAYNDIHLTSPTRH